MRAVVFIAALIDCGSKRFPFLKLGAGELLVKVAVCGVCPTDIKKSIMACKHRRAFMGTKTAGTIVKIGGGVVTSSSIRRCRQNLR